MLYSYRVVRGLWAPTLEEFRDIEKSTVLFALCRFRASVNNLVFELKKVLVCS
ncbi:hypothetical protein VP249E411_P0246 [Vibrio phage 249E41-1]|nr:hypothetical protein VP249E411_P0246 [Vibrio phage 249E41-1]CAH9017514.1 hypothetical protein VP193E371_P0245 [Vibrio phage 193E37-1]